MRSYTSESEVIGIIEGIIGAKVTHHRDSQATNTLERKAVFKAAIYAEDAEPVVNSAYNIGAATDRSISYVGSETNPTEQGEIRYLLFETKINPLGGE